MKSAFARRKAIPLDRRIEAVRTMVSLGNTRLPQSEIAAARATLERAEERMALGPDLTVVALAGATGSGKSSLFNALVGSEISQVGVRRPTTSVASAAVWGDDGANGLLDWLEIGRRHQIEEEQLDGLVLLDLPDHDSTEVEHRREVDRLVGRADLFVWVVDPQKYADALLHEGYLRPLAAHSPVTVVVLNHIDRLDPEGQRACIEDLGRLLRADGLDEVAILATSAVTGSGLEELRALIARRVEEKRAAAQRLSADVDRLVEGFRRFCASATPTKIEGAERTHLIRAMSDAAGAGTVADAAERSYRRDAGLATGWPFLRWVRRFRPDPLARLHLDRGATGPTSLRVAEANRAEVENAVRATVFSAAADMPDPWPRAMRARAMRPTDEVLEDLDRAVSRSDVGGSKRPRWWAFFGAAQTVIAVAALIGFLWLTVLFALQWLQIPRPPTPEANEIPWPTLLLLGGVAGGLLLAWIAGWFARAGARRRRRRAYDAIAREIEGVAEQRVLTPIAEEQQAYRDFCDALATAS